MLAGLAAAQAHAQTALSGAEVSRIVRQAADEAAARGKPATIAVADRVGNVLGVFQMGGAPGNVTITSGKGIPAGNGLEGLVVPATFAAISKAITGAYLSSNANAFTTRTANQIIQEHFNPGEFNQPGGPLFGVQFSQLLCSDLTVKGGTAGPKPSPLGLSADPGGLPLYKGGALVGGIGVAADGIYGIDADITRSTDLDVDELIALAGSQGFEAPNNIRANRITVDGKTLRFTDAGAGDLLSTSDAGVVEQDANEGQAEGQAGDTPDATEGEAGDTPEDTTAGNDQAAPDAASFVAVSGFTNGSVRGGVVFGTGPSGFVPSGGFGVPAFVLAGRYGPRAGTDGGLTGAEVRALLANALAVAARARAQIRRPASSAARVTVSVVDTNGAVLGIARSPDAPVFGTDVSLQKARTAAFFSRSDAGSQLTSAGMGRYVSALRAFGLPTALADGTAFSDRAGGNLSRPFYPDGIDGNPNGPLSVPISQFSPFNVGLQLDLVAARLTNTGGGCTGLPALRNGIQIFPGSVPIYRGGQLVGGIGVSGDGVDQDDMIAFLGLHNAGEQLGTINNADPAIRADNLSPRGVRLRYINCPQAPFIDSSEGDPCSGL